MSAILEQLDLDASFFVQLGIFLVLFVTLGNLYFRPFLRLFEIRHKKTVEDREAAERLMQQAHTKLEDYKRILAEEKAAARKEYEEVILQARKEEANILAHAREEAKKITQEAVESISRQRDQVRKQLEGDIETMAKGISESLLSRKV